MRLYTLSMIKGNHCRDIEESETGVDKYGTGSGSDWVPLTTDSPVG
jgi:hypothetical protein